MRDSRFPCAVDASCSQESPTWSSDLRPPRRRPCASSRSKPSDAQARIESDLHFLALLETLSAGAAPSRVATYYTGTGELYAEPVDEHLLVSALLRTISGIERLLGPTNLAETQTGVRDAAVR